MVKSRIDGPSLNPRSSVHHHTLVNITNLQSDRHIHLITILTKLLGVLSSRPAVVAAPSPTVAQWSVVQRGQHSSSLLKERKHFGCIPRVLPIPIALCKMFARIHTLHRTLRRQLVEEPSKRVDSLDTRPEHMSNKTPRRWSSPAPLPHTRLLGLALHSWRGLSRALHPRTWCRGPRGHVLTHGAQRHVPLLRRPYSQQNAPRSNESLRAAIIVSFLARSSLKFGVLTVDSCLYAKEARVSQKGASDINVYKRTINDLYVIHRE